jgi:hypothetical protein
MQILKALWIGGPPGKTMINLKRNLAEYGIDIIDQWESVVDTMRSKHKVPDKIDIVLLNHEMCSHPLQDKMKKLCRQGNKRFILASMNTTKTVAELVAKNVIKSSTITEHEKPMNTIQQTDTKTGFRTHVIGGNVEMFEDQSGVWVRGAAGDGTKRRTRPVGVGDGLFLSATEAAGFLGIHKTGLSALKEPIEIHGFKVWFPDFDEAVRLSSSITTGITRTTPVDIPVVSGAQPELTGEIMDVKPVDTLPTPEVVSDSSNEVMSAVAAWENQGRKLRVDLERERVSLVHRLNEIDTLLGRLPK